MRYNINMIEQEMTANGSHWWSRDTMRFFKCRVGDQVYQGPGGIYFVTSERNGTEPRKFSVRQYFPASKDIDTIGDFNSMSRSTAHGIAKRMAATPLQEQFDDAMVVLDNMVTGSDKSENVTKYGTVDEARNGNLMYLSDGGYTRVIVREYDDSSGYYLQVIPTFATDEKNEEVQSKFRNCYELQQEVARVLKTEPAGGVLDVTTDIHIKTTASQQLAIDVVRGGGRCSIQTAGELIRYAKRHHKMMEDYCNGIEIYGEDDEPLPKLQRLRASIESIAKKCQCGVVFSGDPRGCTVKLTLPNGETNDWGKEGWCIPTN